jgi:hypothetical protein
VQFDELETGEMVVFGTFQMTVVKKRRNDTKSLWVGQDTIRITKGKYRMLLEDERQLKKLFQQLICLLNVIPPK